MGIIITKNENENISYDFPGCVYDTETPIKLTRIPFLEDYFGNKDKIRISDNDGTWIKSSANTSHFTWDHGKYERHFIHGSKRLT